MAQTVKLKRSNTAGTIPTTSNLELGEVAINTKDGKFYLRKHVDGSSADQILAFAPQGVNAFGTQEFVVKVAGKTAAHPYNGSGSSNGYVINGLESPYLALIPGNTYKFDVSDSSNSGHPFRFYLEADKTTAYTTGVTTSGTAGNANAYVQIAVTTATPSQLYYQCSNHAYMGSASYVIAGTTALIADNSVVAAKIAANAVGSSEIAQNSVTSVQIPNNSIGSTQISAAYTSGITVADNGITSAKIASNSILTRHIDDNQIGIDQLNVTDGSSGQVLRTDGSGTLSFVDQSSGSVTEAFKTIAVSGQDNVVADSATDTLTFVAGSNVTISTNASGDSVTFASSNVPGDDTVTSAKIVAGTIVSSDIAANTIATSNIADNAIDSTKIAQNSILTKHIDDNQIGIDQLNVSDGSNGQALVTDGSGNLSFSTISGGGGSQNLFQTIAVSGQSNVIADSTTDTLTLAGGSGVTITTNASTDTITIATSGEANQNAFSTVSVSGQSDVVADSSTDTLTFVAGSNMTITTSASGDSVTFASSGSGGSSAYSFANMNLNEFSGDGSTTAFTLGQTPGNEDNLIVFIDGVYQNKDSFSISGTTLTMADAPANGRKLIAYVTADAPTVALGSTTFTDQFTTANNSTTTFTLSKTVPSEDNLMVFVDAAFQSHDDLSLSGTTLTLATAPPSGAVVTIHGFNGAAIGNTPTVSEHTGDGSTTGFTLSVDPTHENNTNVYIDGVYQHKNTYAVSGTTLTFSEAPPNSSAIDVHILNVQSLATGSIVSGSLAANSVVASNIAANAVGASEIAASGVTAASYGSSSAIPVITVDADGRITSATTAATSSTLTIAADSGSNDTVTVGTDTLTFAGTSNEIETTVSNNQIQIGLPDNPTVGGNLTVTGNLTVNGSTTTVSTANMTVEDNLIELNTGASSNANDSGIVIERGSTGDNAIFAWDESADKFIVGTTTATGASTGNLTITAAPLVTGALTSSSATIASLAYPTSDGTSGQAIVTDGSGSLSFGTVAIDGAVIDTYASTGNGSTTAFDTSISIVDEKNTWVFVDGVYQPKDTYSTSGTTVTFSAAPPNGADVEVLIGKVAGFDSADTVLGKYSTTTSGTGYSTGITFTNENNTFLFIDGIYQPKDTYSVSGSTLTLDADPVDGLDLELIATKTLNASAVETAMLANNAVSSAKIASNAVGTTEIATDAVGGAELAPAALSTQTLTGAKSFTGNLTVDTNTLHVDSANNRVGIGTASPDELLVVDGAAKIRGTNKLSFTNTSDQAYIHAPASNTLAFGSGSAERMRIDSSGNVMIGSQYDGAPGLTIEDSKNLSFGTGNDNESYVNFFRQASSAAAIMATGYRRSSTSNKMESSIASSWAKSAVGAYYDGIRFYADTASADAVGTDLTPTERMRIHASGCVGVGSDNDRSIGTNIGTLVVNGSAGGGLWLSTGNSSATSSKIYSITNGSVGELIINSGSGVGGGSIKFTMNADATPTAAQTKMYIASNGRMYLGNIGGGTGALNIMGEVGQSYDAIQFFHNSSTAVGYIRTASSSTTYSTSSDYRLKENVEYSWDATTRLKQLKPARFNFKTEKDTTLDGFLAHEVSSIVPEAITGEKDGEEMQGIDHSKLVPLLVKTVQELEARITELEG